jgi:hypothetical protein
VAENGIASKKGKRDQYANVGYGAVTMSGANVLTFSQIQFAVGIFQGIALVLHRIQWFPGVATIREIVTAADDFQMALVTSNRLTAIMDLSEPAIITAKRLAGIAAAIGSYELPFISDFSSLPMGGKLIPANPIYLAANSAGFAAAGTLRCVLEFTFLELSGTDYLELLQAQYPANIA